MWLLGLVLMLGAAAASPGTYKMKGYPCCPHSQPWQAAVYKGVTFSCGATLIARRWVLTAAHCNNSPISVRLGKYNLNTPECTETCHAVEKTIIHPGYNYTSHEHDLMLVKLKTPVTYNRFIEPLALATRCVQPGEACLVSGWGSTLNAPGDVPVILYCANVTILSWEQCSAAYPGSVKDTMVCAAMKNGGTESCEGDSGGPLVCDGRLQGLVSWGDVPCITTMKPGVYVNVCKYYEWIRYMIQHY